MSRPGSWLLTLLLCLSLGAEASVTASVDRTRIAETDSLELTIRGTGGEPVKETDLSALEGDFEIASRSVSSRLSTVNGKTERSTELRVVLMPLRAGGLLIPPLAVGTAQTREIPIEVTDAPSGLDSGEDVFVLAEVDREAVYVQSQLVHTFQVYEAIDLVDRGRSQLEIPEALVEELDASQFQRNINGRVYRVTEVRHAIFPQKSGELTIPAMSFNGSRLLPRRSFFDRNVETLRRRSQPITVQVKPIPLAYPDAPWIPSTRFNIEESWSALPEALKVGDSVTRTLTMVAEGIAGSQLPAPPPLDVPGIKAYPDQPQSDNRRGPNGVTGTAVNSTALLITEPGEFELPAVQLPWWDTEADMLRYAEVPTRRLRITAPLPASAPAPDPATIVKPPISTEPAVAPAAGSLWLWTTLAALLGWAATTAWLLWRMSPGTSTPAQEPAPGEARLWRELAKACQQGRAMDARTALQRWGRVYFEESAAPTLQTLRQRFGPGELSSAIDELERSLFAAPAGDWSGAALGAALKQWRKRQGSARHSRETPLPPLYPSRS